MSEDRLEAIRKDFEADPAVTLHPDVEWLLDEIDRLRAEVDATFTGVPAWFIDEKDPVYVCANCGAIHEESS